MFKFFPRLREARQQNLHLEHNINRQAAMIRKMHEETNSQQALLQQQDEEIRRIEKQRNQLSDRLRVLQTSMNLIAVEAATFEDGDMSRMYGQLSKVERDLVSALARSQKAKLAERKAERAKIIGNDSDSFKGFATE